MSNSALTSTVNELVVCFACVRSNRAAIFLPAMQASVRPGGETEHQVSISIPQPNIAITCSAISRVDPRQLLVVM